MLENMATEGATGIPALGADDSGSTDTSLRSTALQIISVRSRRRLLQVGSGPVVSKGKRSRHRPGLSCHQSLNLLPGRGES